METLLIGTIVAAIASWIATSLGSAGPFLAWLMLVYCAVVVAQINNSWRLGCVCITILFIGAFAWSQIAFFLASTVK